MNTKNTEANVVECTLRVIARNLLGLVYKLETCQMSEIYAVINENAVVLCNLLNWVGHKDIAKDIAAEAVKEKEVGA